MAKIIVIDSFIGPFGYSKQFVRNMLNEFKKEDEVEVQISSLGGSLDHALAIHDMFAERGNITSKLTGFIASAATIIALSTNTRISENSFYLIHKVLSWVDEWGMMNEDDLDQLIEKLTKEKKENEKMTLLIAKRYHDRAKSKGKSIQDVLELMKQNTWITPEEAHEEWGFVDEVYKPSQQINYASEMRMVAMLEGSSLPPLPRNKTIITKQINMKTLKLERINTILQVENLQCDEESGSYLNETQLQAIENRLTEMETQNTELGTKNTELGTRNAELEAQNTELGNTNAELVTQNTELGTRNAELEAQNTELGNTNAELVTQNTELGNKNAELISILAKAPATKVSAFISNGDPNLEAEGSVDWDAINSLPHNQNVQ